MQETNLFGMKVHASSFDSAVQRVAELSRSSEPSLVVTPNVDHFLRWQREPEFRELYSGASLTVLDGMPLVWLSSLLHSDRPARVTGVDLLGAVCAVPGVNLAIIGGAAGVAEIAGANLVRQNPGLGVALASSPELSDLTSDEWLEYVAMTLRGTPNLVVALCVGSPKQEALYARLAPRIGHGVFMGVGAAVDFYAGQVKRAPRWMQRSGLEWTFRLAQEPKRLWRRYLVDDIRIVNYFVRAFALRARSIKGREPRGRRRYIDTVYQVGPHPLSQGGIASVIAEYMEMADEQLDMKLLPTWLPNRPVKSLTMSIAAVGRLLLQKRRGVVVHSHLSEFGSFAREGGIAVVASLLGYATVVTLHGAAFPEFASKHKWLARVVLRRCQTVLCLGIKHESIVRDLVPNVETRLILNPVQANDLPALSGVNPAQRFESPTVLFAGEVGLRKGFDRLLSSWERVLLAVPDAKLVVCGPLADGFTSELGPNVEYRGLLPRSETRALMSRVAVTCLPSRSEVLPMTILESLAAGTRVVATEAGEFESFEGSRGIRWIKPTENVTADLAHALVDSLSSEAQEEEKELAREWVQLHASRAAVRAQSLNAYENALRKKKRSAGARIAVK